MRYLFSVCGIFRLSEGGPCDICFEYAIFFGCQKGVHAIFVLSTRYLFGGYTGCTNAKYAIFNSAIFVLRDN